MRLRRHASVLAFAGAIACALGAGAVACTAFDGAGAGADPGDADAAPDAASEPVTVDGPDGATSDGSTILDAGGDPSADWTTPNGAVFVVDDDVVRIVDFTEFNHPVVLAPAIRMPPSETYTVRATVLLKQTGEFGLVVRAHTEGAVFFGARYGSDDQPFLALVSAEAWNPMNVVTGPAYELGAGQRYRLVVKVEAATVRGKLWAASTAEPVGWQVTLSVPPAYAKGRGFGFYTYHIIDAQAEEVSVSVP